MDQEPATPEPAAGKPGIFHNLNTVIAGLTALVIALGGLATATKGTLWGKEPAGEEAAAPEQAAQADASAEPAAGDPLKFAGADGVTLEWDGEEWVLIEGESEYRYDDIHSPDPNQYRGYDKSSREYLRWPKQGGMAETGTEDKQSWSPYLEFQPVES